MNHREKFFSFSLVDLGEENDRELKMPSQIAAEDAVQDAKTVETAEKVTVQMVEQAGETPAVVRRFLVCNNSSHLLVFRVVIT